MRLLRRTPNEKKNEADESLSETDLDDGFITDGGFDKALVLRGDGLAARARQARVREDLLKLYGESEK